MRIILTHYGGSSSMLWALLYIKITIKKVLHSCIDKFVILKSFQHTPKAVAQVAAHGLKNPKPRPWAVQAVIHGFPRPKLSQLGLGRLAASGRAFNIINIIMAKSDF